MKPLRPTYIIWCKSQDQLVTEYHWFCVVRDTDDVSPEDYLKNLREAHPTMHYMLTEIKDYDR